MLEHGVFMSERNECAARVYAPEREAEDCEAYTGHRPGKFCFEGWKQQSQRFALTGFCLFSLLVFAGCGGQAVDGRYPISGTVTFKGQPLEKGTIEFSTSDRSQLTGATIEKGKYSVPAEQGLKPGKYTVKISSTDDGAAGGPPPPPGPENTNQVAKELIPEDYNLNSKITADVTDGGANKFDFDIP